MRVVSPLLKHVIYPGLSWSGVLRSRTTTNPVVLTYHGVFPRRYVSLDRRLDGNLVTAKQFRQQLAFLKNYYSVICPEEFQCWARDGESLPSNSVMLTCDDGLRNNVTEMLPILQEFGMKCLFFVTGDSVGESGRMLWHEKLYLHLLAAPDSFELQVGKLGLSLQKLAEDHKQVGWQQWLDLLSELDSDSRDDVLCEICQRFKLNHAADLNDPAQSARFLTMNLSELRQLAAAGMTIGAHSISHPKLSRMTSDGLVRTEISTSRDIIERALEKEVWAFAYPFGNSSSVSDREIQFAQDAGFACAFLNTEAEMGDGVNLFALPRIHISSDVTCGELDMRISGVHASLRRLLA